MATDSKKTLLYKGRPLMRKDNIIYYGSMADSHIVMMQILETTKVGSEDVASKVSVQLQLTDQTVKSRDRVIKKSEKDGIFSALDVGSVWLEGPARISLFVYDNDSFVVYPYVMEGVQREIVRLHVKGTRALRDPIRDKVIEPLYVRDGEAVFEVGAMPGQYVLYGILR